MKLSRQQRDENKRRARRAGKYVRAYRGKYADRETATADLLADLFHYCNRHKIDIDTVIAQANRHYDAEIKGEL